MSADRRLKVVLGWHMHQPQYQDLISGEYHLPWTYLHAIKDYVDMAAHLEAVPSARAVVNFAPILLEQIADYSAQIDAFLNKGGAIKDALLAALAGSILPTDPQLREVLVKSCLRANQERLINRFPPYRRLADLARAFCAQRDTISYASEQFLADILVWYHLAWMGETVRREDARIKLLIEKGGIFTLHDRRILLEVIGELLTNVIGRYQVLGENGQVELSFTPYAHPIVPLLLDFNVAKEAMPHVTLPLVEHYPGGEARAHWHVEKGIEVFKKFFGSVPQGCWPSEGGVSNAALKLLGEHGIRWIATGEQVLSNSLTLSGMLKNLPKEQGQHRIYEVPGTAVNCFFRNDGLSDLIGFTYQTWHADDAIANLIHHLENIAAASSHLDSVVTIMLDGENAWESYPENGYYFLRGLYERLAAHPKIHLTTFSECLDAGVTTYELPRIVAGSWVYGTFSTWIGNMDKNRAWDMLAEAKRRYDAVVGGSKRFSAKQRAALDRQLAICEGSDWFWWFGDYNPAEAVSDFERLFRLHLANLYQLLGEEPPEYLSHVFAHGGGTPQLGGVMRRGTESGV